MYVLDIFCTVLSFHHFFVVSCSTNLLPHYLVGLLIPGKTNKIKKYIKLYEGHMENKWQNW